MKLFYIILIHRIQKKSKRNQPFKNDSIDKSTNQSRYSKGTTKGGKGQTPNKDNKNKTPLNALNPHSKRGFKKRLQPKLHGATMGAGNLMTNSKQQRIVKRFKGANQNVVNKLSTGRLAAYGLDKRKKQNKSEAT